MGLTKTTLFTDEQNKTAKMARAFAHPARVAILQNLLRANTCINSDLVKELGLAQATISQHLRELKEIGLIKGTIEGASMCYCIEPKVWEYFKSVFVEFFGKYNTQDEKDCC